jgi:hypothetical protein
MELRLVGQWRVAPSIITAEVQFHRRFGGFGPGSRHPLQPLNLPKPPVELVPTHEHPAHQPSLTIAGEGCPAGLSAEARRAKAAVAAARRAGAQDLQHSTTCRVRRFCDCCLRRPADSTPNIRNSIAAIHSALIAGAGYALFFARCASSPQGGSTRSSTARITNGSAMMRRAGSSPSRVAKPILYVV